VIAKLKANNLTYYSPAIVWGFLIAYFTLIPGSQVPKSLMSFNDKLIHGTIYFFSASLIILAVVRYNFRTSLSLGAAVLVLVFCMIFGGLIEILQHEFVSRRNGDWLDFWANNSGAALSVVLWSLILGRKAKLKTKNHSYAREENRKSKS
jgi:VanZ family protein